MGSPHRFIGKMTCSVPLPCRLLYALHQLTLTDLWTWKKKSQATSSQLSPFTMFSQHCYLQDLSILPLISPSPGIFLSLPHRLYLCVVYLNFIKKFAVFIPSPCNTIFWFFILLKIWLVILFWLSREGKDSLEWWQTHWKASSKMENCFDFLHFILKERSSIDASLAPWREKWYLEKGF